MTRKPWDNTTLRLRMGDVTIEQRSIEAELRLAAESRLEPKEPKRGRRSRRRQAEQLTTW